MGIITSLCSADVLHDGYIQAPMLHKHTVLHTYVPRACVL
jgi:hypothetical protein